jgi:hypothetical protein
MHIIVEKSSKYYLVKNILLALFEIIDSGQVPQNAKRKVPYLTGSGGIHLNESMQSQSNAGTSVASSTASSVVPSPTTTKDSNSNHNENIRLTMLGSNISRMSVEEPEDDQEQQQAEASGNELIELITRCLRICGEEDGFLPLFKVVFAALADLEDNKYTHRLDGRGRDILLTGLITRMIRYVSEHVGLVFISDDVQCESFCLYTFLT